MLAAMANLKRGSPMLSSPLCSVLHAAGMWPLLLPLIVPLCPLLFTHSRDAPRPHTPTAVCYIDWDADSDSIQCTSGFWVAEWTKFNATCPGEKRKVGGGVGAFLFGYGYGPAGPSLLRMQAACPPKSLLAAPQSCRNMPLLSN